MYKWLKDKFAGELIFDAKVDPNHSGEMVGVSVRRHGRNYSVVIHSPGKVAGEHYVIVDPNSIRGLIEELSNANEAVVNDMMPKFGKRV
jgi:hypothetical protein